MLGAGPCPLEALPWLVAPGTICWVLPGAGAVQVMCFQLGGLREPKTALPPPGEPPPGVPSFVSLPWLWGFVLQHSAVPTARVPSPPPASISRCDPLCAFRRSSTSRGASNQFPWSSPARSLGWCLCLLPGRGDWCQVHEEPERARPRRRATRQGRPSAQAGVCVPG